jgi:hypothetical protein
VALPDGRMALVFPKVDTDLSIGGLVQSGLDALNLLPEL